MKKTLSIILLLLCLLFSNAVAGSQYLKLSKIDFSYPYNNTHAIYLDIYGIQNIPNLPVIFASSNGSFDWSRTLLNKYSSPYGNNQFAAYQNGVMVLFKEGTLPYLNFQLMSRLMYTTTEKNYSIDLIAQRSFYLGDKYYRAYSIIDRIYIPEPASICLLGFGMLCMFKRKFYEN